MMWAIMVLLFTAFGLGSARAAEGEAVEVDVQDPALAVVVERPAAMFIALIAQAPGRQPETPFVGLVLSEGMRKSYLDSRAVAVAGAWVALSGALACSLGFLVVASNWIGNESAASAGIATFFLGGVAFITGFVMLDAGSLRGAQILRLNSASLTSAWAAASIAVLVVGMVGTCLIAAGTGSVGVGVGGAAITLALSMGAGIGQIVVNQHVYKAAFQAASGNPQQPPRVASVAPTLTPRAAGLAVVGQF